MTSVFTPTRHGVTWTHTLSSLTPLVAHIGSATIGSICTAGYAGSISASKFVMKAQMETIRLFGALLCSSTWGVF